MQGRSALHLFKFTRSDIIHPATGPHRLSSAASRCNCGRNSSWHQNFRTTLPADNSNSVPALLLYVTDTMRVAKDPTASILPMVLQAERLSVTAPE